MRPLYEILGARADAPVRRPVAPPPPRPPEPAYPQPSPRVPTASPPVAPAAGVSGRNVTQAGYGQDGRSLGEFRQVGPAQWVEVRPDRSTSDFRETGRDDWSVHLRDDSRGIALQIDLHRRQVLIAEGGAMRPLYAIVGVRADAVPPAPPPTRAPSPPPAQPRTPQASALGATGRDVSLVDYGRSGRALGEFRQVGPAQWRETGIDGGRNDFVETARDEWSVLLTDHARGVRIQLDLHRRLVLYADAGNPSPSPMYDVLSAGSPPVAGGLHADPILPVDAGPGPIATGPGTNYPVTPDPMPSTGGGGGTQKEFCWKDSYGRGMGVPPETCAPGQDRIGLLCYSQCPAGTARFGFDCHTECPQGMTNNGLFCRASEYGRGVGYPWKFGDGLNDDGMRERCEADHGRGQCEINGLIQYPKCKPGYEPFGCCICRPKVPDCAALGMNPGIDLSCAKKVTIGDPMIGQCPAGQESDAGLCYPRCEAGYDGVGPVCWAGVPNTWVNCGMGAARDSNTCAAVVVGQVQSVGQVAFNVATLGTGTAASGAASAASKATRLAELKRRYEQLKALYERAQPALDAALRAKQAHGATLDAVELMDEEVVTEADILRISAQIAAIADPTGVADTVAAYSYPKCSAYGF
jgi:hypothetical protein